MGRDRGFVGVTLALAYAQRHPERVLGMVLAAVTSGRWRETQWITRDMGRVFPHQWDRFTELLPEAERGGDLAAAYARLLSSSDQALREETARRWCEWEDTHMSLAPGYEPHLSVRELSWQMVFARLVTHYWGHGCFLADNEVLANMAKIAHPGHADSRPARHLRPARHGVAVAQGMAREPPSRHRRRRSLRRKHERAIHRRDRCHGRPTPPRHRDTSGARSPIRRGRP